MPRVMTTCPDTGHVVPTHAVMTTSEFRRLGTGLAMYCIACGRSHFPEVEGLWLEGSPMRASPVDHARPKRDGGHPFSPPVRSAIVHQQVPDSRDRRPVTRRVIGALNPNAVSATGLGENVVAFRRG